MPSEHRDATNELLAGVDEHWEHGWTELVRRCESKLRILLHFRLRGRKARSLDPEDLLQEVWAEAMRRYAAFEYRGPGSFYAWLAGILRNKLRHAVRASADPVLSGAETRFTAIAQDASGPRGLLEAIAGSQTSVSSRVANAELEEKVKHILERLPDKLREVIMMRIYEACSGRETAAALGVHESVVSVRMKQAIAACARLMKTAS